MAFKDNLRRKIEINELARRIKASLGPAESGRRIDKELVRQLLAEGDYEKIVERDLELYRLSPEGDKPRLLVLDNDLPIYATTVEDVVLRKSPLVKEMLNIRNVFKILNDGDVVISKKEASLETLRGELVSALDLRFTQDDIDDLVYDGRSALENRYVEGVQETLRLFFELLGYAQAPKPLQVPHQMVWGMPGEQQYGPLVLFDRLHHTLKRVTGPIDWTSPDDMAHYEAVVAGSGKADERGDEVFEALGRDILETLGMAGTA